MKYLLNNPLDWGVKYDRKVTAAMQGIIKLESIS